MKKFLLLSIGLGIIAVSCGTKESSMSSSSSDSAAVDTNKMQSSISTTDSVTTTTNPDSIRIKMDTVTAPATK
ncbi:cytochrome C551 [Chryseobacterium limigenitum]|uniref:Cytochrome C551 n=1 Tax=Chryseobacterium limigenitum TaxID=1612149 RepID=A0A1K2IQI2_9FLAO|nr:cytochrome C551 [Chryseobacterium limigenitum]SFZ94639.1 hypothetical protein SAMN05216324_107115 [Chryseobacterium limigenitum]